MTRRPALDRGRTAAVIFGGRVRSAAADAATDLRHRADRACLPVPRLPLPPDQPAPHRHLRHLRRGPSRALCARLRAGAGGRGRRYRGLDHADRRSRHRHRGGRPARRPDRRALLGHLLASASQPNGEIVGVNVAAEEITERKRAEAALGQRTPIPHAGGFHPATGLDGRCAADLLVQQSLVRIHGQAFRRSQRAWLARSSRRALEPAIEKRYPFEAELSLLGQDGTIVRS